MKRSIIATIIACLLIGVAGGYGAGYVIYEPKVRSYEVQVSGLTSEVSRLNQTVSGLSQTISDQEVQISDQEAQLSSQKALISNQETQISNLESEKASLQEDLALALAQAQFQRERATKLNSELSDSENRMNKMLDVTVTQNYQWKYGGSTWTWELPIPLSVYVEYLERTRPSLGTDYVDMAKGRKDDPYIDQMVQKINDAALKKRFTEVQKLNFVIAFVQSLPYTVDLETTPYDEYPRYPVETLFDRGGDCEDTSILVAALLDRLGYDVALLLLKNAKHMAVGVSIAGTYGLYYEYNGKKYFYLETTGEGWQIGQIPPSITDTTAYIYPIRS